MLFLRQNFTQSTKKLLCQVGLKANRNADKSTGGFQEAMRLKNYRRIGIDLDNTIACYEKVFEPIAIDMGLIPGRKECWSKLQIRETLQKKGRNDLWTHLQGEVYGPGMQRATIFAGVREYFLEAAKRGYEVWIVSHRSRRPAIGTPHDLWLSAVQWLNTAGLLRPEGKVLRNRLLLAPTREAKVREIIRIGCTDFIDDLPEVFSHQLFPRNIHAHLFDPAGVAPQGHWRKARRWQELRERTLR